MENTFTSPRVGDSVVFNAWGGDVRIADCGRRGRVVRINRNGYPVVRLTDRGTHVERTDRHGCAKVTSRRFQLDPEALR